MHRGFVPLWRKLEESPIARASHLYYRLWCHILIRANWKERLMAQKGGIGIWIAPGTLMTSMDALAEGISYEERGIEKRPNRKTIRVALDWMSGQGMISVESNRFGTVIFIINWGSYAYLSQMKVTPEGQPNGHQSNNQTDNQTDTTKPLEPLEPKKTTLSDHKPIRRSGNGYSPEFEELWSIHHYGSKKQAGDEYKKLTDAPTHDQLKMILMRQVTVAKQARAAGDPSLTLPHLCRWFKHRRFEDAVQPNKQNGRVWDGISGPRN